MLAGVAVFCAGSVLGALAPDVNMLIAGRVVMGVGAAASEPGTLSILRHVYPDRATRADALGRVGRRVRPGPGPRAGDRRGAGRAADWRAIFWFNLVFGAGGLGHGGPVVPESSDPERPPLRRARDDPRARRPGLPVVRPSSRARSRATATWWIDRALRRGLGGRRGLRPGRTRAAAARCSTLGFFRRPPFVGSNFVAFATYFGTFSIFFFTALYVQVVVTRPPYQMALDFLPMAAGTDPRLGPHRALGGPGRAPRAHGGGLPAGRRRDPGHQRRPSARTSGFCTLGWTLPIAGIGFGMALVPVTSAALTVVPPERSGMAASATNTSRELGAVVGVAVLGSMVNSKLTGRPGRPG